MSAQILGETGNFRKRKISFLGGTFDEIYPHIPKFEFGALTLGNDEPVNPYLRTIIRKPRTRLERAMPVATVSNTYTLLQHRKVAVIVAKALRDMGLPYRELNCELGLTDFGELMVFRMYLPDDVSFVGADKHRMGLRVECFNSVDTSYRLVVLFGWLRFVCMNGLVIGDTLTEVRQLHSGSMNLNKISEGLKNGLALVEQDRKRLENWEKKKLDASSVRFWVDHDVKDCWGAKAAARVFHIAQSGCDVELPNPFSEGLPSEKPIRFLSRVPGQPNLSSTVYDLTQVLSFVATGRQNFERRVDGQADVPRLIEKYLERANSA